VEQPEAAGDGKRQARADQDDADPRQPEKECDLVRPLAPTCRREADGGDGHARKEHDCTDQVEEERDLVQSPKFVRMRPGSTGATMPS
jgi:hypothetical protein